MNKLKGIKVCMECWFSKRSIQLSLHRKRGCIQEGIPSSKQNTSDEYQNSNSDEEEAKSEEVEKMAAVSSAAQTLRARCGRETIKANSADNDIGQSIPVSAIGDQNGSSTKPRQATTPAPQPRVTRKKKSDSVSQAKVAITRKTQSNCAIKDCLAKSSKRTCLWQNQTRSMDLKDQDWNVASVAPPQSLS